MLSLSTVCSSCAIIRHMSAEQRKSSEPGDERGRKSRPSEPTRQSREDNKEAQQPKLFAKDITGPARSEKTTDAETPSDAGFMEGIEEYLAEQNRQREHRSRTIHRLVDRGLAAPIEYGASRFDANKKVIGCILPSHADGLQKLFYFDTGDMAIVEPNTGQDDFADEDMTNRFQRFLHGGLLLYNTMTEEQQAMRNTSYEIEGLPYMVVASNRDQTKVAEFDAANQRVKQLLEEQINGLPQTITANDFENTVGPYVEDTDDRSE